MADELARANTDRLLWRGRHENGDYYADSVSLTEGDGIALQSGSTVIVLPIKEWMRAASRSIAEPEIAELVRWIRAHKLEGRADDNKKYERAADLIWSLAARLADQDRALSAIVMGNDDACAPTEAARIAGEAQKRHMARAARDGKGEGSNG